MRKALGPAVVCWSLAMAASVNGADTTVYSNLSYNGPSSSGQDGFWTGDTVTLAGTSRVLTKLEIPFIVGGTAGGTTDIEVCLYLNDGTAGSPGTVLWDSGVLNDVPLGLGNNLISVNIPGVSVPDTFIWAYCLTDQRVSGAINRKYFVLPTVGSSDPTFYWWKSPVTGFMRDNIYDQSNLCGVFYATGESVITIGTGTSTASFPMGTYYHDERTQVIYLAGEIGGAATIQKLALDVAAIPGQTMNYWTIRMKHTSLGSYSTASWETGWTTVYQGTEPSDSTGWRTFNFSTPFSYNGASNLMIDFSFNNSSWTADGMCRCSMPGGNRTMYYQTDSGYGDPLTWSGTSPSALVSPHVPNIQLTLSGGGVNPTVTAITPNSGINTGTVSITNLAGANFQAGATVKLTRTGLSDISATGVTVVGAGQITCTFNLTGAVTGQWNVVVTNPGGQSGSLTNGFTVIYPPPTVSSIYPSSGMNISSVNITNLAGSNFQTGATVKLTKSGQTDIVAADVSVLSAYQMTCAFNLAGAAIGQWNVVVTNPDGQPGTLTNGFTVNSPAPTVSAITPDYGINTGSVGITNLSGNYFQAGATVRLTKSGQTDIYATGVVVDNATKIHCGFNLAGAVTGPWNVVVTNPDGKSGTRTSGFTVRRPPIVVYVKPTGSDNNTGLSWDQAKETVQAGIDASAVGDQIWVAAGIYNASWFSIGDGYSAVLFGGFAGNEDNLSQRNFAVNRTTLEGSFYVYTTDSNARIDGFTIQKGYCGISIDWSFLTIANCKIIGNKSHGIRIFDSPTRIINCVISGNSGAGIYCEHCDSCSMANCTITGNGQGGISCRGIPNLIIGNNIIAFNSSGIWVDNCNPFLANNCVYNPGEIDYDGLASDPTDILADPLLSDPQNGNAHLTPSSPCINAGDDAFVVSDLDIDYHDRIYSGGGSVDIGADEFDGTVYPYVPQVPRVFYVSPSGNDNNTGRSWAQAKKSIWAGLEAAGYGDQVWVAAGIYDSVYNLKLGVGLYGGFAGMEDELSQRNWAVNVTILDGRQEGSVVTSPSGASNTTRIDGFTLRNGTGTRGGGDMYVQDRYGGGIYCENSSPIIANCTISGNSVSGDFFEEWPPPNPENPDDPPLPIPHGSGGFGGGIYCEDSSPSIINCTISENAAIPNGGWACGGGIYGDYYSSPAIINCTFVGNHNGAVECSSATIANCVIASNDRGISNYGGTNTLISNCVFNDGGDNYGGGPAGPTDIVADPKLEYAYGYGRYRLKAGSPCIDAGSDNATQIGWRDMDCQPRKIGSHVDIGADEYDGTVWSYPALPVIYVSTSGNDNNAGISWAQAKRTVQNAIDAASLIEGEIWVAAGIYNERITLRPFAYVYGGFRGSETARTQRNWTANPTILDGSQWHYTSVVSAYGTNTACIDGFTIRNGTGTYTNEYGFLGGGLYLSSSSPTIANCRISGNSASGGGGGLGLTSSSPMISNCTISGNSSTYSGGGLHLLYDSSPTITNCTISGNSAVNYGGGVYLGYNSFPTISNTIVAFNNRGIYNSGAIPILRYNCVFGNTGYDYSGFGSDPTGTNGNISQDPLFADNHTGNFHLLANSPCINAGNDDDTQSDRVDMDGQPRISGTHVDIGADEYYLPGDANGDGAVALADFATLQNHYGLSRQAWSDGDFNGDGWVTFEDFTVLQNHYGQTAGAADDLVASAGAVASAGCIPAGAMLVGLLMGGVCALRIRGGCGKR